MGCFDGEALGTILNVESFPGILNLADKQQPKTNCNQTHCYHACYFHRDGWYIVLIHRLLSKKLSPKMTRKFVIWAKRGFSGHFGWKWVGWIKIVMNKMSTGTTITESYRQNISAGGETLERFVTEGVSKANGSFWTRRSNSNLSLSGLRRHLDADNRRRVRLLPRTCQQTRRTLCSCVRSWRRGTGDLALAGLRKSVSVLFGDQDG